MDVTRSRAEVQNVLGYRVPRRLGLSDDAGNEYFSEGLSEELLNLLVKIPELQVAARTSSFSYKGKDVKIAQIAKELNVAHVLEGSVRKSGDRVRITAQLIEARSDTHLWSENFDRTLDDIFEIQDEISQAIVDELQIQLLGVRRSADRTDPETYALYLQALHLFQVEEGSSEIAVEELLHQVLQRDEAIDFQRAILGNREFIATA